jgi:hypothetical protein
MNTYVARQFDVDFIYLDFVFTAIWMLLLWRQKHMLALKFGLAGALITFLADDVWMYNIQKTRILDVPFSPDLYLVCGSFTAGNGDVLLCNCNVQCYEDEYQGVLDSISLPWMGRDRVPVPVDSY